MGAPPSVKYDFSDEIKWPDRGTSAEAEESVAWMALYEITPSNSELLELADRNPPPREWLEGEEEDLF